jgi:hypothetical protein
MERLKNVRSGILFPQETSKVLPSKKGPGNFMCEFCNNDFSYLCRKDLNEHREMCMVEPIHSEILTPKIAPKVSGNFILCKQSAVNYSDYGDKKGINT